MAPKKRHSEKNKRKICIKRESKELKMALSKETEKSTPKYEDAIEILSDGLTLKIVEAPKTNQ